jgi:hypothetical protein
MAERFSLFGSTADIHELAQVIGTHLGVTPRLHESEYVGLYFRLVGPHASTVEIKPNAQDEEGELLEQNFSSWPVLVYESDSQRKTSPLVELDQLVLLREEWLEPGN